MRFIKPCCLLTCYLLLYLSAFADSTIVSQLGRKFDITYYNLELEIFPANKEISGSSSISFKSLKRSNSIEIDLSPTLTVDSILYRGEKCTFNRESGRIFIDLPEARKPFHTVTIFYHGKPVEASNPPWEGGFVWQKDSLGRTWVTVACETLGASSWWPCKDSWGDEPDSAEFHFVVDSSVTCISNGVETGVKPLTDGKKIISWRVHHPINTYNVTLNVGAYTHFSDTLVRNDHSKLPLDYYVLDYNRIKAEKHFQQVPKILTIYESLFGNYPFEKDGYALVETPYWGMEHQSAIAYGNKYRNQMLGLDYIIVHETAHEWWGNSITASDPGDMWIHEAFATYTEALLVEKLKNYSTAIHYLNQQKLLIENKQPVAGPLNCNFHHYPDTDMYYKGSWMLHTIRSILDNDSLWFNTLKEFAQTYKYQLITRKQVFAFFSEKTGIDLLPVFEQYLFYPKPPRLHISLENKGDETLISLRWDTEEPDFKMPVELIINGKIKRVKAFFGKISFSVPGKVKSLAINSDRFLVLAD